MGQESHNRQLLTTVMTPLWLCYLKSNATLARRMDKVEGHSSTPINPWLHSLNQPHVSQQARSPRAGNYHMDLLNQVRDPLVSQATRQFHTQLNGLAGCHSLHNQIKDSAVIPDPRQIYFTPMLRSSTHTFGML